MTSQLLNDMSVELDGEGEALLCIHGLGGSSNCWTPLMPTLGGYRWIRPDLPGSARSALPAGGAALSIASHVRAMEGLLAQLGLGAVHVVAHSLGTIVAQHLAQQHPGRVKSLALFGPLAAPPEAARAAIAARADKARGGAAALQEIADAIVQGATSRETKAQQPAVLALVRESVMRQPPEGYAQNCAALAEAQSAALERLDVPALLVTGDQDGVAPPAHVRAMHERLAGSRMVVVLEGCGHWTPFEQPLQCARELEAFHAALR